MNQQLPIVLNGRLEKSGQVDFYQFEFDAGKSVQVQVEGNSLLSPIDPLIHVYDPSGTRMAIGNDRPGGLDPLFQFSTKEKGKYTIAVMAFAHGPSANVSFHGAADAVYRLRVEHAEGSKGGTPNDSEESQSIPFEVEGVVRERAGKRFTFSAKKGQKLDVGVSAAETGSPLDAVLRIEDAEGKLAKEVDDTKTSSDPEYLWPVAADGTYALVISDRFGRSGDEMRFVLSVAEQRPEFSATVAKTEFELEAGGSLEIPITVNLAAGYSGKLFVRAVGLPSGAKAEEVVVPEKGGTVKLKVTSSKDVSPSSKPFNIEVFEKSDDGEMKTAKFSFPVTPPGGAFLVSDVEDLWLTVKKKADEEAGKDDKSK